MLHAHTTRFERRLSCTQPKTFNFTVGTLKCIAINDCIGTLPDQRTVKDVPADQLNPVFLARGMSLTETVIYYNCLYIQTDQLRILVDGGLSRGNQQQSKGVLDRLEAEGKLPMPRSALPKMEGTLLDRFASGGHHAGRYRSRDHHAFRRRSYRRPHVGQSIGLPEGRLYRTERRLGFLVGCGAGC